MDVKGVGIQGVSETIKMKSLETTAIENKETSSTIIEKGIKKLTEQRETITQSKQRLEKQVEGMNELLESSMTTVKFNVHEGLDRLYVQVVNKETNEIVKEIPPEKFLDMVATMLKHAGLIVDERV